MVYEARFQPRIIEIPSRSATHLTVVFSANWSTEIEEER
jgi:hypothetical protein